MSHEITYLELVVGRYRCALRANCVLGVLSDVTIAPTAHWRGVKMRFADLRLVFEGVKAPLAPFAVAIDVAGKRAILGVDRVGHVRRAALAEVRVPDLGLTAPGLVPLALRDGDHLWMALHPEALIDLEAPVQ